MSPRILVAICLLTSALSLHAQERFTIERIEIRGVQRIAPSILAAETMLREGSEVSAEEVRAGVRRLVRLPFVFAADYTLAAGSNASRRVVVLNVTENHRFWFLVDGRFTEFKEPVEMLDYDYPDPTADWKHAAGGARWLFGDGGLAHFALTVLRNRHPFRKNYSAYELGYTRHRILGTPFFATAILRSPVDSLEEKTFSPEIVAGVALTANQTLCFELEDTTFVKGTRRIGGTPFRDLHAERNISGSWTYDTTDQPYVPTQGTFLKVEPFIWMGEQMSVRGIPGQAFHTIARHSTAVGFDLTAERHWPLSDVSSASAGVQAGWSRVHARQNPAEVADLRWQPSFEVIEGGYQREVRGFYGEVKGGIVLRQVEVTEGEARFAESLSGTSYEVSASVMRRYRRAALRLGFTYID